MDHDYLADCFIKTVCHNMNHDLLAGRVSLNRFDINMDHDYLAGRISLKLFDITWITITGQAEFH